MHPPNDATRLAIERVAVALSSALPLVNYLERTTDATLQDLRQLHASLAVAVAALRGIRRENGGTR